jgi:hypothetical protein
MINDSISYFFDILDFFLYTFCGYEFHVYLKVTKITIWFIIHQILLLTAYAQFFLQDMKPQI